MTTLLEGRTTATPVRAGGGAVLDRLRRRRATPAVALLASAVVPGLGTVLNGEVNKGLGILVGFVVSAALTVALLGLITLPAFWIFGLVDAYRGASRVQRSR